MAVIACLVGGGATLAASEEPVPVAVPQASAVFNVSLTFDSGTASQMEQAQIMAAHGLRGTFFINSGFVGANGYMGRDDLQELANDGQEVGGHTFTLGNLPALGADEAKRQICHDRVKLTGWGFKATSFSYPFGATNAAIEKMAADCGYNSARSSGTVGGKFGCDTCAAAETVIPQDVYATRATASIDSRWTLADLQAAVRDSEAKGSWLQLVFGSGDEIHGEKAIPTNVFEEFCAWLADQSDRGVTVRTVHEIIGNRSAPAVSGPTRAPAPPGVNALVNPGLETPGEWNLPQCWQKSSYGKNSSIFSTVSAGILSPGIDGETAARLDVLDFVSGDAKILPTLDLGQCSPAVVPGHSYSLGATLTSTAVTQIEVYLRDAAGQWTYWTASPWFAPSEAAVQYSWATPPIPKGAEALSFGFNLFADGSLVTDNYSMIDTTGVPAP
ncbi:polysaccharide deacetylase family protein [Arthrobacter sp. H35-D1]|uniref:polysaccharide deacetylase family protein n=1 Tax=Arthrobacter sp. H35-D1 TaxID=3046202 RepID=UPI0024BB8752|nr:polysaccharide deacetylase family protein [Arthrobacter sp. H35-D1]